MAAAPAGTAAPARSATPTRRRRRRASPEWEGREIITVAALPGRGLYVRHLNHPEGVDGVHRATVQAPHGGTRAPVAFHPAWLARHVHRFDVVHVHGLSSRVPAREVARAADLVRAAGKPLVVTGYHLSDPTGLDEKAYAAGLDALVPRADAVVTLTDTAAEEMRRRWDVDPVVLPHPHAVDFVRMRQQRPEHLDRFVVGTHLGSLGGAADATVAFLGALAGAVETVGGAHLVVHVHDHVLDAQSSRYDPLVVREVERIVRDAGGTLRSHRPFTDSQLWDHLVSLDASVLPPLPGSHSVWPEACFDLGTQAVLPDGCHAAGQQDFPRYRTGPDGPDPASMATALEAARAAGSSMRADPADRWKQRVQVGESLRSLYERGLAAR